MLRPESVGAEAENTETAMLAPTQGEEDGSSISGKGESEQDQGQGLTLNSRSQEKQMKGNPLLEPRVSLKFNHSIRS
jgi:hypothetical protein